MNEFERLIQSVEQAKTGPGVQRARRPLEEIPIKVEGPTGAMCAATMCPLFAPDGSPWTGNYRAACQGPECGFYDTSQGQCDGGRNASAEVKMTATSGRRQIQLGPVVHGQRGAQYIGRETQTFDCPYENVCQWQKDAGEGRLCPPRLALQLGVDPAACAY